MQTAVKICGLKRSEDIQIMNRLKPEFAGFVFAKSRRQVTEETAAALREALLEEVRTVGVFVNEAEEKILRLCRAGVINLIQLHGDEDIAYMQRIREKTGVPVIRAIRVRSRKQLETLPQLPCDYLLLDTFQKDAYGGTGKTFDWSMIPKLDKPFFLAGGLNAENASRAIEMAAPFALDASGSLETEGVKDEQKVRAFLEAVRGRP